VGKSKSDHVHNLVCDARDFHKMLNANARLEKCNTTLVLFYVIKPTTKKL